MSVLWGLLSCCGLVVAAVAFFVAKGWVTEKLNWFRWRRRAPAALDDIPPPVPEELRTGRTQRRWRGGYLDGGHGALREQAQRLLRHGVVRQAKILEADFKSDADDFDGYIVYAFRQLDGSVVVERTYSSVNTWGAAVSTGVGSLEPAFDIIREVAPIGWMHVLIDPETGAHLIYEALLVERGAHVAPAPTGHVAPEPLVRSAPPNIFVPSQRPTLLAAAAPTLRPGKPLPINEARLVADVLALFPAITDNDDDRWQVIADMLIEQGSSRGELMALQLVKDPTPAHRARIAEIIRTQASEWLPPGVHPRRFEFRRGLAWSVQLHGPTDFTHIDWQFIRHVAFGPMDGNNAPVGFERMTIFSLTGVGPILLWHLLQGRFPQGLRSLEVAMAPHELEPLAERLRRLPPLEVFCLRGRRQQLTVSSLAAMLDALPLPQRVRLFHVSGDVRGFQREVAQRAWLRSLELISLESTVSTMALEISASAVRVVVSGRFDVPTWDAMRTALRAQGFASIPLVVRETGETREQSLV